MGVVITPAHQQPQAVTAPTYESVCLHSSSHTSIMAIMTRDATTPNSSAHESCLVQMLVKPEVQLICFYENRHVIFFYYRNDVTAGA